MKVSVETVSSCTRTCVLLHRSGCDRSANCFCTPPDRVQLPELLDCHKQPGCPTIIPKIPQVCIASDGNRFTLIAVLRRVWGLLTDPAPGTLTDSIPLLRESILRFHSQPPRYRSQCANVLPPLGQGQQPHKSRHPQPVHKARPMIRRNSWEGKKNLGEVGISPNVTSAAIQRLRF